MRVIQSPRAERDVLGYYAQIALRDQAAAERFLEAVDRTYARLSEQPGIGSKRLWRHPGLHGIRAWPVRGYEQFLVYYLHRASGSVWISRVLRASVPPEGVLRTPP